MSDGLAFLLLVAACVLFAVWMKRPKPDPLPDFTPAEDAPAFKDETGVIPQVAPISTTCVPLLRPKKNGAVRRCPACYHGNKRYPCRASLRPTKSGKVLKCSCKNAFHKPKPVRKRAA